MAQKASATGPRTLVLAPPNMTVPASGPSGLVGDRVHQAPALSVIHGRRRPLLLWPDDVVTRTFFSFPEVEFVPDASGAIGSLVLHQGGHEMPAKRH